MVPKRAGAGGKPVPHPKPSAYPFWPLEDLLAKPYSDVVSWKGRDAEAGPCHYLFTSQLNSKPDYHRLSPVGPEPNEVIRLHNSQMFQS